MDVKLKDFSDGMLARLSFSVAFHVDADIILIDEVIAVGDLGFQRKCLEKIENLKREGKTIVLVSQSPDIIRKFCDRGMILKEGKVVFQGSGAEVAEEYTDMIESERLIETNTKKDLKFCARYKHDFILKGGEKAIMEVDGDVEEIIFFGKTIAKAVTLRKEDGKTIFYTDALPLNEGHYDVLIRQGEKVFGPFKIYVKRGKKRNGERVFVVWGKPFKGLTLVSGEKKEKIDRLYREGNSVFIFFDLEDLDEEVSLYEKHEIVFSGKKEEAFKILKEKVSKQLALRYFQDILENKELGRIVIA